MESQQNSANNIKSERLESTPAKNDLVNDRPNSESDEVSPSDTVVATSNSWLKARCTFCQKSNLNYNDSKLLECLHSVCIDCANSQLTNTAEERKFGILCNTCQTTSVTVHDNPFLSESTPTNDSQPQIQNDNSRLSNIKCTSCHDSLVATSWCADCNDFLCDGCVQAHQRLKITKDHTIKSKEEAELENNSHGQVDNKLKIVCCPIHPQEKLSLFCESCDTLTCRDCQLSEHKLHGFKFIDEIAIETKENIKTLLNEIMYKRELLKNATKVINDRQQMITDKKKESLKEITQMVVKLTNAVTSRGKQLVNELNKICDSKQKTLNEKKVALDQLSLLTDQCIEFISNALSQGSDAAVLKTKTIMLKHLQTIKSKRADIPNPEIPVRIQLGLERTSDICLMISRLGVIFVDGRQYGPQLQGGNYGPLLNQQNMVNPFSGISQSQHTTTNGPSMMHTRPITYNTLNNNIIRGSNVVMSVANHRSGSSTRVQYTTPNMPYNGHHGYQQQVTSSTHPQNSVFTNYDQGLRRLMLPDKQTSNMTLNNTQNIRSVTPTMQPGMVYQNIDLTGSSRVQSVSPQSGPMSYVNKQYQQQQQQPQYQSGYMMLQTVMKTKQGRSNIMSPGARQIQSRENSLSPLPQQQFQWHIPQINNAHQIKPASVSNSTISYASNDDSSFKITLPSSKLKPLVIPPAGASVSSSVPKTPSPLNQVKSLPEDTEKNLDQVGQDSVDDLMATIARLDSNCIKIQEVNRKQGDSPLVDSSTGPPIELILHDIIDNTTTNNVNNEIQKGCDDPNEDWCAVCMDGGHLVCCDNCPKVFHINCHIPSLPALPEDNENWQCMLCTNIMDCVEKVSSARSAEAPHVGLTEDEKKIMERVLLELYCQYETSLPFREVVSREMIDYYKKIKKPMSLDIIRKKLARNSETPYQNLNDFIGDIRLVFQNAYSYNAEDSQIYNDAKTLEEFFNQLITKWLPNFTNEQSSQSDTDEDTFDRAPPRKRSRTSFSD